MAYDLALPSIYARYPGSGERVYRTLCDLLSGRLSEQEWQDFDPAAWQLLARMAEAEGVAPLVYGILKDGGWPAGAPEKVRARLAQVYYQETAHNSLLFRELARILQGLRQAGIPVIVMKGAALAGLYPEFGLRPMVDLDLLVMPDALERAVQVMYDLGYSPGTPEITQGINTQVSYNVELRGGPQDTLTIELHWSLVAALGDWRSAPTGWFWQQTGPFEPGGSLGSMGLVQESCAGMVFNPTAQLLYLAAHLFLRHSGLQQRLLWFYDIYLLVEQNRARLDWDDLLQQSDQFQWAPALDAALRGVQGRFGLALPAGFLSALSGLTNIQTARYIRRQAEPLNTRTFATWGDLSSLSWKVRLRLIRALVFPSRAYLEWRYHPRPAWLWPFFYPYRWGDILKDGVITLVKIVRKQ